MTDVCDTGGNTLVPSIDYCCYCEIDTSGKHKPTCPMVIFGDEDVALAEVGMYEYNEILCKEDD